jgi:hypothetical protein
VTTLAAMRAALDTARTAVVTAAAATRDDFALWPPATAPHGPHAARQVAQQLADTGAHSHLSAHGEDVCLSGTCPAAALLAEVSQ